MKTKLEHKKRTGKQMRYPHELIKVKIGNGCLLERMEAAEVIAERTGSEIVQVIGKTFLVFRENPDRKDEHRIKLPA
jgi:RNA-binding protein